LSALDPGARELIAFEGPVQCEAAHGAVNLVLRAGLTQLLFSGASGAAPPARLDNARVIEIAGEAQVGLRRFRIESPGLTLALQARQVQLHRDAAAEFYGAVPPVHVPLRLRLGWALLLTALRVPGAAALLRKLRGSP
jgi:hypothetical protein